MEANAITLFTTRLKDANIAIFRNRQKVDSEEVVRVFFSLLFPPIYDDDKNLEGQRKCWNSLDACVKETAIEQAYHKGLSLGTIKKEEVDRLIKDKNNIPPFALKDIWFEQWSYIYANAKEEWSIYKAADYEGVYAMEILYESRKEKEWIEGLLRLAKTIDKKAKQINLVIHRGDFGKDPYNQKYTYALDQTEIEGIFGGKDSYDNLMNRLGIESIIIITYSHTSGSPIYLLLKDSYETDKNETICEKVKNIYIQTKYYQVRCDNTINKKGSEDPIKKAYEQK